MALLVLEEATITVDRVLVARMVLQRRLDRAEHLGATDHESSVRIRGAFTDREPAVGGAADYRISALNSAGESAPSTALTGPFVPAAPTDVEASDGTYSDRVAISWSPVIGAVDYRVYAAEDDEIPGRLIATTTATQSDDTEAVPSQAYRYRVGALGAEDRKA